MASATTRVLVAGSSRPHAEALGRVLDAQHDLEVVGVALSAEEASGLVEAQPADVVVAEPDLFEETAWTATVRDRVNGASPVLIVPSTNDSLAAVLQSVRRSYSGASDVSADPAQQLTRREQSVLELLGQALPPKQVAQELGISVHTCRGYVKTILSKLEAHSILEAVLEGQRRGLLPLAAPRTVP